MRKPLYKLLELDLDDITNAASKAGKTLKKVSDGLTGDTNLSEKASKVLKKASDGLSKETEIDKKFSKLGVKLNKLKQLTKDGNLGNNIVDDISKNVLSDENTKKRINQDTKKLAKAVAIRAVTTPILVGGGAIAGAKIGDAIQKKIEAKNKK